MRTVNRKVVTRRSREQVRREKDPIPWRFCLVTLVCGGFLVGGFFLAARTHFASIEFAIRNSTMKKQLEDLESEKRRLMWVRETALAPAEIKKAARKLGLVEGAAQNFASYAPETEAAVAVKTSAPASKMLIQKTSDVKPVGKTGPSKPRVAEIKEISRVQIAKN